MAKYISKDALVAEIEKLYNGEIDTYTRNILDRLKSNIDTLEVKEVNLGKEIDRVWNNLPDTFLVSQHWSEFQEIAKHFFELGLQSTLTEEDMKLIWTIGDDIPYMAEEEFFEEILKRFKAKKGE